MPKTIRNLYDKALTIEKLNEAHKKSSKGKGLKKDIILFNLNKEEYIKYLYENLKNRTYKHGGYRLFYITEPKLRKIESSKYIDRIVHRWYVDNFITPYFVPQLIETTYACLKDKGMHKSSKKLQEFMQKCKRKWNEYYIIKMDITKYFQNINKQKLSDILCRKIKDEKILWLTKEIIYSTKEETSIPIRKLYITNICKHILK